VKLCTGRGQLPAPEPQFFCGSTLSRSAIGHRAARSIHFPVEQLSIIEEPMSEIKPTQVFYHAGTVTREERTALLKQAGATIWFTGLSGSGKSTLAVAVEQVLIQRGHAAYVLDGDNIRFGLNAGPKILMETRGTA